MGGLEGRAGNCYKSPGIYRHVGGLEVYKQARRARSEIYRHVGGLEGSVPP
ncbi:hypothetical protein CCP3SC15_940005 [Gammaproteobacteria bacterium]